MNNSIQFLLDSQRTFQNKMGHDFQVMTHQERAKYIKEMILWSTDELHEMLHEIPFAKTWSEKYTKPEYNHENQIKLCKEEYVDFLHFALNIALALDMDENEIIEMYKEKNKINYERQESGY